MSIQGFHTTIKSYITVIVMYAKVLIYSKNSFSRILFKLIKSAV